MKKPATAFLVLSVILMLSTGFSWVTAAKPQSALLAATMTSPVDGLEVESVGSFMVSGTVACTRSSAGVVEAFVQYALGEGSTDFANVQGSGLQILSGAQPQTQSLLEGQSYGVNWLLTGSPGVYEVRIYSQGSTSKPGASASSTVTIMPPPLPPGVELVDAEYRDPTTGFGTSTGTYFDTYFSDDVYEVLSEQINTHGTKKPGDDTSELGWIFEFSGLGARNDTVLHIECHAVFPSGDAGYEMFVVQAEYAGTWYEIAAVRLAGNDREYDVDLPDNTCQTLRIRIADNDRTVGDRVTSSFYIDCLYLSTGGQPVQNPGKEILTGGYYWDFTVSAWEPGANGWCRDRAFPVKNLGWGLVDDILIIDVDGDNQLETITGGSGSFVQIFECINGAMVPTHTFTHPGSGDARIQSIAAADLDGDGDPNLEILVSTGNFDIQSAVFKMIGGAYTPVFTISSADTRPVGGADCAVGDVDGDMDIEFVVTEEYPDADGVSELRLFDYQYNTWVNIANYSFELGPTMSNWVHTVQIVDADCDGMNEIFVNQGNTPVRVLEYSNGEIVVAWEAPHKPLTKYGAIVADINNDLLPDILVHDILADVFIMYELVADTFVNTFNFSAPVSDSCGDNSLAVSDIDQDGQNELVFVYNVNNPDPRVLKGFLAVYRNGVLVFSAEAGYRESYAVAVGDYDNDCL